MYAARGDSKWLLRVSKGGRRGGDKGSFKQGNTIVCPVSLGPGCHPRFQTPPFVTLRESHGVEFTEKTHRGPRATWFSSDFFEVLSKMALFIPSHEMKEGLINIQNEGTAAAPGSSKISPED